LKSKKTALEKSMAVVDICDFENIRHRRNMKLRNKIMWVVVILLMGCTTMKESLLLGGVTGAATGAAINNSIDRGNPIAATNGALAGVVVGLAASYFIHDGLEKRDSRVRRETLLNLDKFNVSHPAVPETEGDFYVTDPKVETQCFDSDVRGNKLIEAHCESVIVDRPEWVKRPKKGNQNKRSE
jgi:hypothetical protein